jgi:hypothetical protein
MTHRAWIVFSGFVWFAIGTMLLYKGLQFITDAAFQTNSLSFQMRHTFGSSQEAATALIALGLIVGFFKGRYVLSKTVQRVVLRLAALPLPIRLKDAYTRSYWLLILGMMGLGMVFRFLPIPLDARGTIDVAIGSALINGAILYFRSALQQIPSQI